jgi:hypothetical protein
MRVYHLISLLLIIFLAGAGKARVPLVFDSDSLLEHRISGEQRLTVSSPREWPPDISVRVTIDTNGQVTDARVTDDGWSDVIPRAESLGEAADGRRSRASVQDEMLATAVAVARRWRFQPFFYRGQPVVAQGDIRLDLTGPGSWRDPQAPMPPIDYAHLRIELTRSECLGACPDYRVMIDGDGLVIFSTREAALPGASTARHAFAPVHGVLLAGVHQSRLDRPALDALIERFRQAHFFGLQREYVAGATDAPTFVLTFSTGGHSWTVTDYIGSWAGMPAVMSALEDAVDEVAGTSRWIKGNHETVPALRAEGFDFQSDAAVALAQRATAYFFLGEDGASDQFVIDLLDAGLPLERSVPGVGGITAMPLGRALLVDAALAHRPQLFADLARRGWLDRMDRASLSGVFAESGGGCDPQIARALIGAGADPMARTRVRSNDDEAGGATALMVALRTYGCGGDDKRPVVAALLALGVDVNATDDTGKTAIFGIEDPRLQEQLLAAGARADVRDRQGNSPAFSSWNDRIVLGLLDAGADPRGHYYDGKTLRQQARARNMPSVLAWLDAHNVE